MNTTRLSGWFVTTCLFLTGVLAALAAGPAHAAAPTDTARVDQRAATFAREQLAAAHAPAAAFAVVRDGHVTASGAVGDRVSTSTPFLLGSLSKSFTALAVMQLVDRGTIDLDAPVTRYIPWFRTADPDAVLTIRQLLDQTSGLPTSAGTVDLDTPDVTLEQRVRALADVHLVSAPGKTFHYCNKNFATLGLVVQQVSGQPYADYVRDHIFGPLKMSHSYTDLAAARGDGLPDGSSVWFGVDVAVRTPAFPGALPDGYLISTAEDMTHYMQAQLDGTFQGTRIVSAAGLKLMHSASTTVTADDAIPDSDGYGFGWGVGTLHGQPVVSHEGDTATFSANLGLLPDQRTGLVVLTAYNGVLFDTAGAYEGALSMLAGGTTPQTSHAFLTTYGLVDLVAALILLAMVVSVIRLVRRARLLPGRVANRGVTRAVIVPTVLSLLAAAAVYVLVFVGLGATMGAGGAMPIATAFGYAPDVTVVVLAIIAFLAARGLSVLILGLTALPRARSMRHA
ncbi:serine hydrolase [Actinopolymorpha pittospori]